MMRTIYPLLLWAGVFVNTAHVFSPVVQVWTHPELRATALREWDWYIFVPLGAVTLALLLPITYVGPAYIAWNAWHFGTQNYGLACLRWRLSRRWQWKPGFVGGTALGMAGEGSLLGVGTVILGPVTLFHGASDLWLSWKLSPHRWWFVLLVACLSFTGLVLDSHSLRLALPWLIRVRMGLGFAHFLYSRWVPWSVLWRRGSSITATA